MRKRIRVGAAARLALLVSVAALVAGPAAAQDDEVEWRGPLRVRSQFPLDLLTLDATPESAVLGEPKTWSLEVGIVQSNTFEISSGYDARVAKYQQGQFFSGWDFNVDDETTRLTARLDWTVSPALELGIEVPFLSHGEGFMDGLVDDTHDVLGLPTNGRHLKPQDVFNVDFLFGSDRHRVSSASSSIGDATLRAKVAVVDGRRGALSALVEAKAPTGSEADFTGSGEWDFGAGLLVSAGRPHHAFHGGISYQWLAQPAFLPFVIEDRTALHAGYEWVASERWSMALQLVAATSILPDDPANPSDGERVELQGGAHYGRDRWQVSFGFIENVTTNDNTADLGFFFSTRWWL